MEGVTIEWLGQQLGYLVIRANRDSFEDSLGGWLRISIALTRSGFEEPPIDGDPERAGRLVKSVLEVDLAQAAQAGDGPVPRDLAYFQLPGEPGGFAGQHWNRTLDPGQFGMMRREFVAHHAPEKR